MLLNYNIIDDDQLMREIRAQQERTRCRRIACYSFCLVASLATFGVLLYTTIQAWK